MLQLRFRLAVALLPAFCFFFLMSAEAQQAPIALPYTMTTLAGTSPIAATGTQCPNLPTGVKSTDTSGDGCLAVNAAFGVAGRGGVQADSFGNVFVADDINNLIHVIDPTTGIMTVLAGGGTACSAKQDSAGDGCLAATQTITTNQRGIGIDVWGNVFLPGYGDHLSHVICRTASPLCTPAQVGTMQLVAGCATSGGTTGSGLDNTPGFSTNGNANAAFNNHGTCSTSLGEINTPRGITADVYGNVYYAETATYRFRVVVGPLTSAYFTGNNPIYAALGVHYASVTQGYVYTVVDIGGTTTPAITASPGQGTACSETTNSVVYSGTALDALGDGCPLDFSSVADASTSYVQGVAVDAAGNMIFTDPSHGLRVFYVNGTGKAGAAMQAAIAVNNPTATPQAGFVYMLAGGGTTGGVSATPQLGNSRTALSTTIFKVTVSPHGDIFIGDGTKIQFFDMNTGYIRTLLTAGGSNVAAGSFCTGSAGQKSLSAYGDGCAASQTLFTNSNGLGVSVDGQNNLYLYDAASTSNGMLVRKVLAQGLAAQSVGTPLIQNVEVHVPETAAGTVAGAAATLANAPDIAAGTLTCGAQNADFSFDCNVAVTATPSAAGPRSGTLTVSVPFTPTAGFPSTAFFDVGLGGTVTGSVLAIDSATTTRGTTTTPIAPTKNQIFSGITAAGVALDGAGNVYTMDTHAGQFLESVQGVGSAVLAGTLPTNASQIAVDQHGDVFAVGSGTSTITELAVSGAPASAGAPSVYTSATVAYTPVSGTAAPQAIAVDGAGNLFVADKQSTPANTAIYRLSLVANTLERQVTVGTSFTNPISLAIDPSGNVYVADQGTSLVYKLTPGVVSGVPGYVQTTVSLPGVTPAAVAVDAAGDLYVQDAASLSVIEVPVSGAQTTVLTGLGHPSGLAVDGKGNVYSADTNATTVTEVVRNAVAYNFGTGSSTAPTFAGTMTDVGNQSITGTNIVTNTTNFNVVGGTSNGCAFSSSILGAQAAGNACTLTANFVGAGSGTISDVVSYVPAATTIGSLTLTGTLQGTAVATTTTISSPTPANPSYSPTGTEATFTVTVAPASGTSAPAGTVAVTVDSTITNPALVAVGSNGVATVTVAGLTAGMHTISAIYGTSGGFTGSNSGAAQSFSIAQDATSTAWTPSATSAQYSSPIGTAALNATATFSGAAVPGVFVYTANGVEVNAGSYLPIGTYTLGVTFVPTDAVDFGSSTASGGTFTVTKATTAAGVGATQMVVASDGSGNFTSVQAAVNTLAGGGSIYIKPGTYSGLVSVVQPNVALRGLGGDPTKVILTAQAGAFGGSGVNAYGGQYTAAQNNGSQMPADSTVFTGDEASATLVVARGVNSTFGTTTLTPTNFYGENFTLVNTYDSDNVNTTTSYLSAANSGSCAVQSTPRTFFDLYNSSQLCASQALAIWITSDQAVMNNVYTTSLQDTIFAGAISAGGANPARQYWFRGKVTGDVDYIFGDAAAVFDHTTIYTAYHGTTAGGTETIEAQNQADQTGASPTYLSGYVMNSDVFTSQSSGMTNLYFGRPYGHYSTYVMLNSAIDQVNPVGYIEFSGDTNLPTSTYAEYNDSPYTDPATGSPDLNGVVYLGAGGSTGTGVTVNGSTVVRETTSANPGTPEAALGGFQVSHPALPNATLSQAEAQQYYPMNFLSATVPLSSFNTVTNWNPTAAIAANVNGFVPSGSLAPVQAGTSMTLVMRPQTPGLGAIANGTYTIPTGTYTLSDSFNGSTTALASGTLDASGEAYFTTTTLLPGTHKLTMTYSGDSNFSGSTSATPYLLNIAAVGTTIPTLSLQPSANATYGAAASLAVTVNPNGSSSVPTGQVTLSVDGGAGVVGTLNGTGGFTFALASLSAGSHSLSVLYSGDSKFSPTSQGSAMVVARSVLQVAAKSFTIVAGAAVPTYTATITGFVNGDTASVVSGTPSLTTNPASPTAVGIYPITASTGTLAASNYTFTFTNGSLAIQSATQAAAVATGDSRTVTEPVFPAVCSTLTATITSVNDDIPVSVETLKGTNPDGARIQAALNSCANTSQAVRLSVDGAGDNSFLSGPLNMPSGVTLLVDPGVVVYFSRNVQDYDVVPGTHTCGTVNSANATSSCLPLINIANVSNVGIMGYGKLDGRGGDTLLNPFPASYAGQSWWGLSAIANAGGSQQNPRFIQLGNPTNVTLYKITLRNSPLFHVSGGANGFTAWDVKISTPTNARNTDGIDPDQAQNFTITRSWISDGDDNVAVGASGAASNNAVNMSITNNHFFAGHGESIGSFTSAGVNNILFDNNMLSGNGTAGQGSSINNVPDSNSTGIRIKSANDRGGEVKNIQYSNSCFQYHPTEIQFTPVYNTNTGTLTPNFHNILLQNLSFLTQGSVGLTGANNNGALFPLGVTFDNVSFATLPPASLTPAPTNVNLTYGPGQVSSNFVTDFSSFATTGGNSLTDNRTATSLVPPACNFTYIAPELTGPAGLPQTIIAGETATAVVILTPVVGGAAYPTGTVTLTDGTGSTTTVTLPGTGDTISIPLTRLSVGTHTFTATYSGDTNYVPTVSGTPYSTTAPYLITVNAGSLASSTTSLSGVLASTSFGTGVPVTATVAGSSPTGTVQFVVNGAVAATVTLGLSGTAQTSFNLPVGSYTISAIYSGDAVNSGSTSTASPLVVGPAATVTMLSAGSTTTTLGVPVAFTANVSPAGGPSIGTPAGTVNFSFTTVGNSTPVAAASSSLTNGVAAASIDLPIGTDSVTATYVASGSFAGSASSPAIAITVNLPTIIGLPNTPIALPYTMTTIAGGSGLAIPSSGNMACAGATDKFGDGCLGTAISFTASDDMRAVVGDVFGNVYLSDISAGLVRRITPNGVISNFAGRVAGTACVPGAVVGCTPTLVSIAKPRGVGTDAAGNIYIADYSANKVFKVSATTGLMYLVAGTGTAGSTGDGSSGATAEVNTPRGAWGDAVGNVYIADTGANNIRVVDATGNIHTFAGTGTASSTGDGGPATAATVNNPQGVITDPNLNVYIADSSGGKIRVVCVTCGSNSPLDALLGKFGIASPVNGDIYTIAGGATTPVITYPTLGTNVTMAPQKLAFDGGGNLYISDGAGVIWFLDFHTGYIRQIASNATTVCAGKTDSFGDGCPATQASFGDGGNGIGVGTDPLGNVYISDTTNGLIRKVVTGLASPATGTAATTTLPVQIHFTAGDVAATTNAFAFASGEWQLGAPTCTTNADTTTDCLLSSGFTPAVPGARSAGLTVTSSTGHAANLALTGIGLGAGATLDPANQTSFGASLQANGVATDNAGNVYIADGGSKKLLRFTPAAVAQGATGVGTALAPLTAPGAVAVDSRGFVYVADTSTGLITQVSPSGGVSTLATKFTSPSGLAVDSVNNLYVSDSSAQSVTQIGLITGAARTLAIGTLVTPAGLAIDPSGNLLVADPGAGAVYRFNQQTGVTATVITPAAKPSAIAIDAAGNLLIADTGTIFAVPASAHSTSFAVASLTPSALAIDAAGNLYTGSGGAVLKLNRTQARGQFSSAASASQTFSLLESGNQALQLSSVGQSDATDYSLAATASTDCTLTGNLPATAAVGGVCSLIATYTPTTYLATTDTATFNGNLSNAALSTPASVQLVLSGPTAAPASTLVLGAFSPASPVFGQTVTVSATASGASVVPTGTVVFTIDSSTQSVSLTNGVATASLTGLTVGTHTVSAAYTSSNGYASSSATASTVTVAPATQTISFPAPTSPVPLGVAPITLVATGGASGNAVVFSVLSGPGTISAGKLTVTGAGTIQIAANQAGNSIYSAAPQVTQSIVVSKGAVLIALTSSLNPSLLQGAVVLTATLSSTAGVPTGTVNFLDGTTLLGTGTVASGVATFTTTTLAVGSHSITAVYSGDANFATLTSTVLTQVVDDFSLSFASGSTPTATVLPGGTAVFTLSLSLSGATTFPAAVTLSVSGLPAGATAVFSPATVAAGAGTTTVTLTIQVPQTSASAVPIHIRGNGIEIGGSSVAINGNGAGLKTTGNSDSGTMQRLAPFGLALLLLPFAGGMRRAGKKLGRAMSALLLVVAALTAAVGLSGCGSNGSGFFTQAPQTYSLTVTGTSGTLSHSTTITLTVE